MSFFLVKIPKAHCQQTFISNLNSYKICLLLTLMKAVMQVFYQRYVLASYCTGGNPNFPLTPVWSLNLTVAKFLHIVPVTECLRCFFKRLSFVISGNTLIMLLIPHHLCSRQNSLYQDSCHFYESKFVSN